MIKETRLCGCVCVCARERGGGVSKERREIEVKRESEGGIENTDVYSQT